MQSPAVTVFLALSAGALGLFAGATFLGRGATQQAAGVAHEPVDFAPLIESMDALRDSIDAELTQRAAGLVTPGPRVPAQEGAPAMAGNSTALTLAIEGLREEILGLRLRSAGLRPDTAGIQQGDRILASRKPTDVSAIEVFLRRFPQIADGELPLEVTFYGLSDYLTSFGWPTEHKANNDMSLGLKYVLDRVQPERRRYLHIRCTRDWTLNITLVD